METCGFFGGGVGEIYEGLGVFFLCVCICVWSRGNTHQTGLATCSVIGHLPAHTRTYKHIHTYAHTPWGRTRDIWLGLSEFSFVLCDLLIPAATDVRQASASQRHISSLLQRHHWCFTGDLQICAEERELLVVQIFLKSVLIVQVLLCLPPCSYLWVADLYFSALIILSSSSFLSYFSVSLTH